MMLSTPVGNSKITQMIACASASLLVALSPLGSTAAAQTAPTPTLSVPDFTSIVAKTGRSVVNISTTESVPARRPLLVTYINFPYDIHRFAV